MTMTCELDLDAKERAIPRVRSRFGNFAVRIAATFLAMTCLAAGGATAQNSGSAEDKPIVMKLSGPTQNDAIHEWMKRFAALVEKNSNGRIKAEVYPASQLGSIPRQIEGTQLGSIQGLCVPPEFLVGVDQRFEMLAAPGLFQSDAHVIKTVTDPQFAKDFLAIGGNKGLIGVGILFNGPAAFVMRAPLRNLADFKGRKIRILASPFQAEQMVRLGATGVPLSLGDVLPALQQGTLDGALGSVPVFSTFHYQGTARYVTEAGQSYILTLALLSKTWFDRLPADLQAVLLNAAGQVNKEIIPWSLDFLVKQRKAWTDNGGELITLTPDDKAGLIARTRSIGDDIVKTKPELKPMWDLFVSTTRRSS